MLATLSREQMLATFAALSVCWVIGSAQSAELAGSVTRIVDGDTFWVCDQNACHKIRICGVNAPERDEVGYQQAAEALTRLIRGRSVRCVQVGVGTPCDGRSKPTNHDRIVAQCFADGNDAAIVLVQQGYACDWIKFSGGTYSNGGSGRCCEAKVSE